MHAPLLRTIPGSGIVNDDARVREALYTILATASDMVLEQDMLNVEDALAGWLGEGSEAVILNINLKGASGMNRVQQCSPRLPLVQVLIYSMNEHGRCVLDALPGDANGDQCRRVEPMGILIRMCDLPKGDRSPSGPSVLPAVAQLHPPHPAGEPPEAKLTEREQEILQLLAEGLLYKEISLRIGISESAVKQHIHRMYGKLHVQNRTEAVNWFFGR